MLRRASGPDVANQWLEEAWRHGEVVADREETFLRFAPREGRLSARVNRWVRRLLRATRLAGRTLGRS
jgi:hypothetical protein